MANKGIRTYQTDTASNVELGQVSCVYIDDDTGERRSEFSRTIKLKNGKWINIPSIHNGHYYTEDELKEAVEDNRMIPTSEHDNFNEAKAATKK